MEEDVEYLKLWESIEKEICNQLGVPVSRIEWNYIAFLFRRSLAIYPPEVRKSYSEHIKNLIDDGSLTFEQTNSHAIVKLHGTEIMKLPI